MTRSLFVFALIFFIAFGAFAQSNTSGSGQTTGNYTYEGLLAMGHAKYVAKDFAGALTEYQKAKSADPGRADAYYFIGCTLKAEKRYQEATSMLASAVTVAGVDNSVIHAKALYVIALTWETAGNIDKAKYAWSDYKSYANSLPSQSAFVAIADARIIAMENWEAQKQKYQIVKDRIAQSTESQ
ncbi:MAG: hypothetical protein JXX29_10830 [Deltaproteobacteria bacterium]|nr:hypothetical protein [Deltaproteobacteria bacterium]MBN2672163.1 hypothetical protein [Deltaproteobacteria bacterium]